MKKNTHTNSNDIKQNKKWTTQVEKNYFALQKLNEKNKEKLSDIYNWKHLLYFLGRRLLNKILQY